MPIFVSMKKIVSSIFVVFLEASVHIHTHTCICVCVTKKFLSILRNIAHELIYLYTHADKCVIYTHELITHEDKCVHIPIPLPVKTHDTMGFCR